MDINSHPTKTTPSTTSPAHLSESSSTPQAPTPHHATRYLIVGITLAIFNYATYTLIALLIIQNNELLWLSTLIATFLTTILAYILHSKITWKERPVNKITVIKFFIWNALLTFAISPGLTYLFSLITPLYQFAFNISTALHLPFDYDFVQSTGVFVLVAIITTILNFFFYDKFVFGAKSFFHHKKTPDKSSNSQKPSKVC